MKKLLTALLIALLLTGLCAFALADNSIVATTGISHVNVQYWQVDVLILEYAEDVTLPEGDPTQLYTVTDYGIANLTYIPAELADTMTSDVAEITAVYTNDAPEAREDKTSVPGKYVVIELANIDHFKYVEKDGQQVRTSNHLAAIMGARTTGYLGKKDYIRKDYSQLEIKQEAEIAGVPAGTVAPELYYVNIKNVLADEFTHLEFPSSRGNRLFIDYYVPEGHTEKDLPLVVVCHGGGGTVYFDPKTGEAMNTSSQLNRRIVTGWLDSAPEDVAVVVIQRGVSDNHGQDVIEVVDMLETFFPIDPSRVILVCSSAGYASARDALWARPDMFSVFVPGNTHVFDYVFSPEDMVVDPAQVTYIKENTVTADYLWNELKIREPAEYLEGTFAAVNLKGVIDNEVAIYVQNGVNDKTANSYKPITTYKVFCEAYRSMGYTDEEIAKLVKIDLYDDDFFLQFGITNFHNSLKASMENPDFVNGVLELTKRERIK